MVISNTRKKYYEANKDKILQQGKQWRLDNPDKAREQGNKAKRTYRRKLRVAALNRLGGKCVVCGLDDVRMLQVDHINGGGKKELTSTNYEKYYRKLRDLPLDELLKEYQLLCANHNVLKKWENNEK